MCSYLAWYGCFVPWQLPEDYFWSRVRMSVPTPPRLFLDMAGMHLIREDALVCSALEFLPTELFPPLFMDAFHGKHIKTLKAMVQAWPFAACFCGASLTCLMWGPYKQCWKHLMSYLPRRFVPGESDPGSLIGFWASWKRYLGWAKWMANGWARRFRGWQWRSSEALAHYGKYFTDV